MAQGTLLWSQGKVGLKQAEIEASPARFFEGVVGSHGFRLRMHVAFSKDNLACGNAGMRRSWKSESRILQKATAETET